MTMRELDELLPEVLPLAPNVPEPVALRYLREAAREFCKRTRLWREYDTMTIAAPDFEGVCTIPDARIVAIEQPRLGTANLEPVTLAWLDERYPDWGTDTDTGAASYVTQLQPNTISIYPRETGTFTARLTLEPSRTAMLVPDFLIDDYGTEIGKGAAGRILVLPNPEFANPSLGAAYIAEFGALLDSHAAKALKGQQRARLRTKGSYH